MKKVSLALVFISLFCCISVFSSTTHNQPALLALVNPSQWGLDNAVASIVSALVVFIVGWFTKAPKIKK